MEVEVARLMGLSIATLLKALRREGVSGVFASERTRRREGVLGVFTEACIDVGTKP